MASAPYSAQHGPSTSFYNPTRWTPDTHITFPALPPTHPYHALQQQWEQHTALYATINRRYRAHSTQYLSVPSDPRNDIIHYGTTGFILAALFNAPEPNPTSQR
ncbi:uncharacterized protein K452DRAFT_313322 [Aplosporella prunicola CBS 121167]|uniref:Uncharacterized protein n=1 Tax=Aplosporella prunicola CBS 121167 TaxID=1176127 RepID=A0A6A6AYM7_9PEZI|nr:uncharacterized protein K452DRAFT_313322 [Aplosporella prunicola CBS 121167]KAF2136293.1 hypothetical protein K452DRAFT_313322 [Aplosporella prunicola CBS 121167]